MRESRKKTVHILKRTVLIAYECPKEKLKVLAHDSLAGTSTEVRTL